MQTSNLESYSTESLNKKKQLDTIAIYTVLFGAIFAIGASFYRFNLDATFPTITFVSSIIALIAAIPVYLEKQKIAAILMQRSNQS